MAEPKDRFRLSEQDRQHVLELTQAKIYPLVVIKRARMLLLSERHSPAEVAQRLRVSISMVAEAQWRYQLLGLEPALYDLPRTGRPIKFSDELKSQIRSLAMSEPPQGHSCWTTMLLAKHAVELGIVDSISHMTVKRILSTGDTK